MFRLPKFPLNRAYSAGIAKVRHAAPAFKTQAVLPSLKFGEISLSEYKEKSWVCLFFYPLDFTFVCPTEIIAMSERSDEFKKLNTSLLGCSVDSHHTHLAWINTARSKGGLGQLKIPLLSDLSHSISKAYGVHDEVANHTCRATFIIDKKGIVRHVSMNDFPVGRSVDEVLRLIEAFQFADEVGDVCPVGWKKGDRSMKGDPVESKKGYFEKVYKDELKK